MTEPTTNVVDKVYRKSWQGKDWLVVPTVMIRAGVLNGELVSATELAKYPASWDGRPFVVGHPKSDDQPVSANDPPMVDQYQVGQLFGTAYDDGALKSEIWLDVKRAQSVDGGPELMRRVLQGDKIEVSTGYFRDKEERSGEWDGQDYNGIARNLRPDHLAALLDTQGACSWKDGCGCPRVNELNINQRTSLMIGMWIPQSIAQSIALGGGEPANELHVTLAYLGDLDDPHNVNLDTDKLKAVLVEFVKRRKPMEATIGGIGQFSQVEGEGYPTYTHFDCVELAQMRQDLVNELKWSEFPVARTHGFSPHVTLGYMDEMPARVELTEARVETLTLKIGDDRFDFPFLNQDPVALEADGLMMTPLSELVYDANGMATNDCCDDLKETDMEPEEGEKRNIVKDALRTVASALGINGSDISQEDVETMAKSKAELISDLCTRLELNADETAEELQALSADVLEKILNAAFGKPGKDPDEDEDEKKKKKPEEEEPMPQEKKVPDAEPAEEAPEAAPAQEPQANEQPCADARFDALEEKLQALERRNEELAVQLEAAVPVVKQHQEALASEKAKLVGEVLANERCVLGKDELEGMDVPILEKLARSLTPASYAGQTGGSTSTNKKENRRLVPFKTAKEK